MHCISAVGVQCALIAVVCRGEKLKNNLLNLLIVVSTCEMEIF